MILFSCVRAGGTKGIGFLADVRRMNVGLTRGRLAVLVVGRRDTLRQNRGFALAPRPRRADGRAGAGPDAPAPATSWPSRPGTGRGPNPNLHVGGGGGKQQQHQHQHQQQGRGGGRGRGGGGRGRGPMPLGPPRPLMPPFPLRPGSQLPRGPPQPPPPHLMASMSMRPLLPPQPPRPPALQQPRDPLRCRQGRRHCRSGSTPSPTHRWPQQQARPRAPLLLPLPLPRRPSDQPTPGGGPAYPQPPRRKPWEARCRPPRPAGRAAAAAAAEAAASPRLRARRPTRVVLGGATMAGLGGPLAAPGAAAPSPYLMLAEPAPGTAANTLNQQPAPGGPSSSVALFPAACLLHLALLPAPARVMRDGPTSSLLGCVLCVCIDTIEEQA